MTEDLRQRVKLFGQKFNSVENAIKACREHHKNLFLNK